ncbi:ACT domain-containing protein [Photobacterium sp. 1_MG-2023]|uniref:ACT domain-containing protein n=1 Tax=Photobacterium sp. 1_MG-2023 TaxID=3062646 RepID=UPI0026E18BEF|nr:ACT domain-containing protein [Photobacterium sp. 1_MG-2023]MDO6707533.1 ACT domain-containing protein [Photobacterium sp. 1_MG-2023]
MSGLTNLQQMIRTLSPEMQQEDYVFCAVSGDLNDYVHLAPLATFIEKEGLTLVVSRQVAEHAGLSFEGIFRCITLTVHSSLEAVGLTAAFSAALAEQGISANVIAAYYHDHIFVPAGKAAQAMSVLQQLAQSA